MRPIFLIARPRSGTTAFRSLIEKRADIAVLGEIFHDTYIENKNFFYNYFTRQTAEEPALAFPSIKNRYRLLEGYIGHLDERYRTVGTEKAVLMSVNYNSLHTLNHFWQNFYQVPFFIDIIKTKRYHVIHMIRRNILQASISELRAAKTGVWHLRVGESRPEDSASQITVNPNELLIELRARKLEIDMLEAAFANYGRCLKLEYETFFDPDGQPVPEMAEKATAFLGLEKPLDSAPEFKKTRGPSLRDSIENFDAVAEVLTGTEFEQSLET